MEEKEGEKEKNLGQELSDCLVRGTPIKDGVLLLTDSNIHATC